jgi:hypothetical protein
VNEEDLAGDVPDPRRALAELALLVAVAAAAGAALWRSNSAASAAVVIAGAALLRLDPDHEPPFVVRITGGGDGPRPR